MSRIVIAMILFFPSGAAFAAGAALPVDMPEIDIRNVFALQRGAKYFTNYCLSCHSAQYMRYSRLAEDLGLSAELIEENLIFADKRIGDTMTVAMQTQDAEEWFGNPPPDLTLVARAEGPEYVYAYLQTFYLDDTRPFGVNNLVLQGTAMPHVLWKLQGWQKPVYETVSENGREQEVVSHLEPAEPGLLTPQEYDRVAHDLTTFLTYMAEPARLDRTAIGIWALPFLIGLFVLVYLVKKEYWKGVH